jgi:hypothetical protein
MHSFVEIGGAANWAYRPFNFILVLRGLFQTAPDANDAACVAAHTNRQGENS